MVETFTLVKDGQSLPVNDYGLPLAALRLQYVE